MPKQTGVAGMYFRHCIVSRIQDSRHLSKVKQENEYHKKIMLLTSTILGFQIRRSQLHLPQVSPNNITCD